ncbi:MAG: ABC transporter ATP-binding protein [Bacilli bacterium]
MNSLEYSVENITKKFGNRVILNNLNYTFAGNYVYAILGESGCGKTTLLNILGFLDNKFEGKLRINGSEIIAKNDNYDFRRNAIGFVFQSYYLLNYLNVEENIKMPLEYSKKSIGNDHFNFLINELNLETLLNENVSYLSGGEKQRVSIARALINKPCIIICDEPTGNLDKNNGNNVINMLKKFIAKDKIIIIVTHDQDVAKQCDCVLKLKNGGLYEEKI